MKKVIPLINHTTSPYHNLGFYFRVSIIYKMEKMSFNEVGKKPDFKKSVVLLVAIS